MFMDVFPRSSGWYDPLMTALFEEGLSELVKDIDIQFYESKHLVHSWTTKQGHTIYLDVL